MHDILREQIEYLIELADEVRFGDCRAADRYRLVLNGAVSGRRERKAFWRKGEIMSKHIRVSHPIYNLLPTEIEGFDSLAELALDMHWSWNHATDEVWRQLDPELWGMTHNPWVVL